MDIKGYPSRKRGNESLVRELPVEQNSSGGAGGGGGGRRNEKYEEKRERYRRNLCSAGKSS